MWWNTSRNQLQRSTVGGRPRHTHTLWKQIVQIDKSRGWDIPAFSTSGLLPECKASSVAHPGPRCSQSALGAPSNIRRWCRERKSLSRNRTKKNKKNFEGSERRPSGTSAADEPTWRVSWKGMPGRRCFLEEHWPKTFKMFHLWWWNGGKKWKRYSFPPKPCAESKWEDLDSTFCKLLQSRFGWERDCGSYHRVGKK